MYQQQTVPITDGTTSDLKAHVSSEQETVDEGINAVICFHSLHTSIRVNLILLYAFNVIVKNDRNIMTILVDPEYPQMGNQAPSPALIWR